ncbi:MAG: molecular chaperone HtpG [Alphaproteobacteria bacterium]|nr:molecular chaperone HtpG [Alphaproteobacteria bacterium]
MSKKQKFKTEVSKLLDIVINSLYSEKYIFLRELISNASDACDKLRYYSLMNQEAAKNNGAFKITITPNAEENTLTISDNGIGMNKDDLINHLGTIAKSGTADFVMNAKENGSVVDLIGKFGVGFYSAFMVADKVEVTTKRAGEEQAWHWVSDGVDGFEISEAERDKFGTDIKLFLKDDAKDYVDTIYLRHIIRTYSDHINYPIVLDLGKAGEETVNTGSALWTQNKAEITDEQYNDFYHHISRNFDTPWLRLHFKAEGSIEYTGLLYIPSEAPYDLFQPDRQQSLKLYVNRVFISDKVEDLMPSYLRFVKGIIDSADLPLNISREMLQQNALIAKIKSGTVSRILKELKKRSENYDDYMTFWKNFGVAFKEGIYEDVANRVEVAELSRFYSTYDKERLTSLDEYIARVIEGQTNIYYITGDDVPTLRNNPQLEAFAAKGIEVLLLTNPIDEFWVQTLTNFKGYPIKNISQADIDLKMERNAPRADEGSLKRLTDFMAELFRNEVGKVEATEKLTKSPVSLTVENGQMSIHLERLMRNHQQQTAFASTRILEVNPYHPLIIRLADSMFDAAQKSRVEEICRLLLDQAKIAEGEAVSDSSFFSEKLSEYILSGWPQSKAS